MTKLAIMGAMQEEIDPLLEFFKDYKTIEYADNKYYEVNYKGFDIVIAHSKIGKVFASLTASTLIQKFSCDTLLFSGVAGAINPKLNIGDMIVATKLCQVAVTENLKVIEGVIATGDQFVHSNERKEFIEKTFNADALEMEGASVAVVCDSLNVPFFILRAISDSANGEANFDFDEFLNSSAKISSNYLVKIVDELIKK